MAGVGNLTKRRPNRLPILGRNLGRLNLSRLANEQRDAQPLFQFLYLLADGAGRHAQISGRNRKTIRSHGGIEGEQGFK